MSSCENVPAWREGVEKAAGVYTLGCSEEQLVRLSSSVGIFWLSESKRQSFSITLP